MAGEGGPTGRFGDVRPYAFVRANGWKYFAALNGFSQLLPIKLKPYLLLHLLPFLLP